MQFEAPHHCLVLTLDDGKVNALAQPLRQYLVNGLAQAHARTEVHWILLRGNARFFSAGADLNEIAKGSASAAPSMGAVLHTIEQSSKPVVALLDGSALGGGFELALACHARLCTPGAKVGLPESRIGLIPGAGGTQRLPRAIGVARAMEWMLSGAPQSVAGFAGTPLVQAVVPNAALQDVLTAGHALLGQGVSLLRDLPLPEGVAPTPPRKPTEVWRALNGLVGGTFPNFEAGLQAEYAAFTELREGRASRAMRHVLAAEQRAAKLDGAANTSAEALKIIGVVGAGTMGIGIAIAVLDSDRTVCLVDRAEAAVQKARTAIEQHYASQMVKGRLTAERMQARLQRISLTTQTDALAASDLVVEAVFEDYAAKEAVLSAISAAVHPDAIIATNTSALDANRLARSVSHPGRFVGLHFFSPANIMKLVEVVRCETTSDATLAQSFAFVKALGKLPVLAGVCDGFIGNRMYARYNAAANDLINMGASPQQVDAALERFGFAMGIFKVGDLAGLELSWAGRKRRALEHPDVDFSVFADRLCEAGRFGQKTGAGWYRYESGARTPLLDSHVNTLIEDWRKERGYPAGSFSDEEIVERCLGALAAEGQRLLQEGIAQREGDIDAVYVNGYGFPRELGGPMFWATQLGWPTLQHKLKKIAAHTTLASGFWLTDPGGRPT